MCPTIRINLNIIMLSQRRQTPLPKMKTWAHTLWLHLFVTLKKCKLPSSDKSREWLLEEGEIVVVQRDYKGAQRIILEWWIHSLSWLCWLLHGNIHILKQQIVHYKYIYFIVCKQYFDKVLKIFSHLSIKNKLSSYFSIIISLFI